MTMLERVRGLFTRGYRFGGEQASHEDQARQANVSIGLMAAAARQGDDDHRIQAMLTERTLRDRQAVLEGILRQGWKVWRPQARRSLTPAQRGELESIRRGLAELHAPVATPETVGGQRMAFFGPVGAATGLIGGVRLWMVFAVTTALAGGWGWVQGVRADALRSQRDEAVRAAEENADAAARWRERSEEYRQAVVDAAAVAREAAAALDRERARQAAAAARERRRNREIANVLAGSPEPPDWRLRDDAAADPGGNPTP